MSALSCTHMYIIQILYHLFSQCRIDNTAFKLGHFYFLWLRYVRLLPKKIPERQKLQWGRSIENAVLCKVTVIVTKIVTLYVCVLIYSLWRTSETYHFIITTNCKYRTNAITPILNCTKLRLTLSFLTKSKGWATELGPEASLPTSAAIFTNQSHSI